MIYRDWSATPAGTRAGNLLEGWLSRGDHPLFLGIRVAATIPRMLSRFASRIRKSVEVRGFGNCGSPTRLAANLGNRPRFATTSPRAICHIYGTACAPNSISSQGHPFERLPLGSKRFPCSRLRFGPCRLSCHGKLHFLHDGCDGWNAAPLRTAPGAILTRGTVVQC